MDKKSKIKGFSKLNSEQKRELIASECLGNKDCQSDFTKYHFSDENLQKKLEGFSENTLTNHALPFGVIPNVKIDGQIYHVPAVIEESSVIAAASKAASFWEARGGFKTVKQGSLKNGQVYFDWFEDINWLLSNKEAMFAFLLDKVHPLTENMVKRGGGIDHFQLETLEELSDTTLKLTVFVNTVDSMGANFINSVLEEMAKTLPEFAELYGKKKPEVLMAILSNYTPENYVTMQVRCPINELTWDKDTNPHEFAHKFVKAIRLAEVDVSRAVTHNKGIMNGADAVILATGNDFRAAEAAVHSFASESGRYKSLSSAGIDGNDFWMELTLPFALGSVGGLTKVHPTAAIALEMLHDPSADELMKIAVAAGLANNFAAVASLITTGIQRGHMKLHLDNILLAENANEDQWIAAKSYFKDKTVSVKAVRDFLQEFKS
jgi:hydroxymethylglutaryl-CoA reductase